MTALRDCLAGAYELPVLSDSMSPRYSKGDRMLVNANVQIRAGDDVLFSRDLGNGTRATVVARLVRTTATGWRVRLLNPERVETLNRAAWPKAELIAGVFHR